MEIASTNIPATRRVCVAAERIPSARIPAFLNASNGKPVALSWRRILSYRHRGFLLPLLLGFGKLLLLGFGKIASRTFR